MTDPSNDEMLDVTIAEDGAIVVRGDIDIAGGPLLEASIARPEQTMPIVIDLAGVHFIDSSGLRSLLGAVRRAKTASSHVTLRNVGPEVMRLLEITGTAGQFQMEPS